MNMELILSDQQTDKTDANLQPSQDKIDPTLEKQIGHWNQEEQKKYVVFVDFFKKELNSKIKRRSNKLFKIMANFIQTRNSIQCRCHHTKLIRTFKYINKIVKNFQSQVGNLQYEELQKEIFSNCPLFNVNSLEFKKKTKVKLVKQKITNRSICTQTDSSIQYEIPFIYGIDQQLSLFHQYVLCQCPYYMFYDN